MEDIETSKDVSDLLAFVDNLIYFVENYLHTNKIKFKGSPNYMIFMALYFVNLQLYHLKSVRLLIRNDFELDAYLIARSMIEGLSLLLWAARKSDERPNQWAAFQWVEDFRLMKRRQKNGQSIDPSTHKRIKNGLKQYGKQFYTKKARDAEKAGEELPDDPYRNKWYKPQIRQIFEKVKADMLYDVVYKDISKWIHWGIKGLKFLFGIERIDEKNRVLKYKPAEPERRNAALVLGFTALLQSAEILDTSLKLDKEGQLEDMKMRFINWFPPENK